MRQRSRSVIAHPHLLGDDVQVRCNDGTRRRYVNLDYAANTPVMAKVWEAVEAPLPTAGFEEARVAVARFVGARTTDTVAWVRNPSEAIDVLAATLPAGSRVLSCGVDVGRRHDVRLLPFSPSPADLIEAASHELRKRPADLVAITGASSVTGEVWPIAELAAIARYHGAKLFVDAAQLAPRRAIDMKLTGIDYLALSGHHLYAPFGTGALIGAGLEHRSPNVIGAVALGAACRALTNLGMDELARRERALAFRLWAGLAEVPGLQVHTLWRPGDTDRVGIATFTLDGFRHPLLAAILGAEHAIGVSHGSDPLVARLLDLDPRRAAGGAVRASLGLGTTPEDIDRLVDALTEIAVHGPRSRYTHDRERDEYRPI
jgi:selenocysteine lyase/cysteine desulfurase